VGCGGCSGVSNAPGGLAFAFTAFALMFRRREER